MTLQEILRAKDKCGGCKYQENYEYGENCNMCSSRLFKPNYSTEHRDRYELDESLKVIDEKAAKFDMIQWAIDTKLVFMGIMLVDSDIEYLEHLYREREQDGR